MYKCWRIHRQKAFFCPENRKLQNVPDCKDAPVHRIFWACFLFQSFTLVDILFGPGCSFSVLVHTREAATRSMEKVQVIKVTVSNRNSLEIFRTLCVFHSWQWCHVLRSIHRIFPGSLLMNRRFTWWSLDSSHWKPWHPTSSKWEKNLTYRQRRDTN